MRDTVSYDIRQIRPATSRYAVYYKRGWLSRWKAYINSGKVREFTSYDAANAWLVRTHSGGYVQLRLVK